MILDFDKVAAALARTKAIPSCPSCGEVEWALVPEVAVVPQWQSGLNPPGIPVAVAVCKSCGFVRMHALHTLGLLPADASPVREEDSHGEEK